MRVQKLFIGIDPGKSGAAVALSDTEGFKPKDIDFSKGDYFDFDSWVGQLEHKYRPQTLCFLVEQVSGNTGGIQGRTSGRSMFTFGFHTGFIHGLITGYGNPFSEVLPTKWQAEFGLTRKKSVKGAKESDADKKRRHTTKARKLFPNAHVIQSNADAFLIALYLKHHYREIF